MQKKSPNLAESFLICILLYWGEIKLYAISGSHHEFWDLLDRVTFIHSNSKSAKLWKK